MLVVRAVYPLGLCLGSRFIGKACPVRGGGGEWCGGSPRVARVGMAGGGALFLALGAHTAGVTACYQHLERARLELARGC